MGLLPSTDRLQEFSLIVNDTLRQTNKKFWYALLIAVIVSIPAYFVFKTVFYHLAVNNYQPLEVVDHSPELEQLVVMETKILPLGGNSYSGFVRVKNLNLDWGVPEQNYVAEFKTLGGSVITKVEGETFILPSSEKLIVFSKFTSETVPANIDFKLTESRFLVKPQMPLISMDVSRVEIKNTPGEYLVSAVLKNSSAFTLRQIHLPVVLFDRQNQIVGVNFTTINEVKSQETRSFQFFWPQSVEGAVRAEVRPEINIFDRQVLGTEPGVSPIDPR